MTRDSSPSGAIEAAYPLTALQEGMLYHTIREPGSGAYLTQYTATLKGPLQPLAFSRAWALASGRHEPFRTFFTWNTRERPLQVVRRQVDVRIAEVNWVGQPRQAQHEQWDALRAEELRRGLDIGVAPAMRFTLVRVDRDQWWFLWLVSHALLDGWSGRMVLTEVYEDYARLAAGEDPVRARGARFGDFVGWTQARSGAESERFWRAALADLHAPTPLPGAGSPATASPARAWSRSTRRLPPWLASAIDRTARQCRVTPSTVFVAAWGLLLARHAEASDVVFGLTLTVRPPELPGVQNAAGLYLNTLPIRVAVDAGTRVTDWLADVQARQSGLREFDYVSLADVQRWSPVPAGLPLFDSLVALERFPERITAARTFGTLRVEDESIVEHTNYPLALLITPGERIDLALVADARYDAAAADRMLARYAGILASLAASPEGTVGDLTMLPEDEARDLARWSASSAPPPDDTDVLELFERIAADRPEADALVYGGISLSYGTVNLQASVLAQRLAERGAAPGTLVGVLLERSPEFIITMLAALKAGAAYVPLDAHAPAARTIRILEQLSAYYGADRVLVVTRGALHPQLAARAQTIDLDVEDLDDLRRLETSVRTRPEEAAYVVFTSGSTGMPKGVVVERRQLAWSTGARLASYPGRVSRFLLLSPIAVDSATAGIYWALCTGGALVLPPHRIEQDLQRLWSLIDRERVSHVLLIPSLYRALLEARSASQTPVTCVVVAGEACSPDVVRLHHERMSASELYNEYGPSEGTVWATVERLRPDDLVTIGRPVPGARVSVLDRARRRTPIGVAGEIAIGGAGVARGYAGEASLTSGRFTADPFVPGGRLYLTGDRGRVLPDGRIEFLGRMDEQIKIRGHRVEPGEIERALESHPDVLEAVVVSSPGVPADEALAEALLELGEAGARACLESL